MREPDTSPPNSGRGLRFLLALAALTAILGLSVPLAPVHAEQPVVTWPSAGQPTQSTVLPLAPYRPLSLEATVGCETLRELGAGHGWQDALRTLPAADGGQGLLITTEDGQLRVRSSGSTVLAQPIPPGDCRYEVVATAEGTRVLLDGVLLTEREDLLPPQVAELATAADPATTGTGELTVRLHPDDRYASAPTALKTGLLIGHLLALAATLAVAVRVWPGRRPAKEQGLVLPRLSGADVAVVAISLSWVVLGPVNWDDAWYLLMARNSGEAGYLGNYIYMFNATENPFVASQYLLAGWAWLGSALPGGVLAGSGWELLWIRLLPLIYGLAIWVLLRVFFATALGRIGRLPRVAWLLLIAHLLWWLPYGMMLRPEPLIALCTAGVLVLAELARRRESLGALVTAVAVAALGLAVSPTGAVAWAPLVMTLPWLIPLLRQGGVGLGAAAALVAGVVMSIVVPIGFADATLGDVLDSAVTHNWYYLTYSWHEEIVHYEALLTLGDTGVWGRRAAVVLTLAVLVLAAIGSGRRGRGRDPLQQLLIAATITMVVALGLLALTPTKWVNHFGAVGVSGTVVLAAALLRSPLPWPGRLRLPLPNGSERPGPRPANRTGPVAATAAVLTVVAAAGLVFAGPNLWRPFSDWGQPFGDHGLATAPTRSELSALAPHLGPIYLRNPLLWVALAGLVAGAIVWWRRRGGRTSLTVDRALLLIAAGCSVALLLIVFVVAPIRQYPGWTVAQGNLQTLTGQSCGLSHAVEVLAPTGPQPVAANEAPISDDPAPAAGAPRPLRPPAEGQAVWHNAPAGEQPESDPVATPWYTLPPDSPATHLTVPVAAAATPEQQIEIEIATGHTPGGGSGTGQVFPLPKRTIALPVDPRVGGDQWQEIPVPLEGQRVDAVRVLIRDEAPHPGNAIAVAAPSLSTWQPVGTVTEGQPVFADQLSAIVWPCVDQIAVAHGMVELPTAHLHADDGIPEFILVNSLDPSWGGTFVQVAQTQTTVTMATRIHPSSPPARPWGQVQRVVYDHPTGQVDLEIDTVVKSGVHREPPVTGTAYSGRRYVG